MVMNTPYVLPKLGLHPTLSAAVDTAKVGSLPHYIPNYIPSVGLGYATSNASDKVVSKNTQTNAGLGA